MTEAQKSLLFHPDCGHCLVLKDALKEKIATGEIALIDASTKEGYEIAQRAGAKAVPECLEKDENGNYRVCNLADLMPKKEPATSP